MITDMKRIKIDGAIAGECGMPEEISFSIGSALEAIEALRVNFPVFARWLVKATQEGRQFFVVAGNQELGESELTCPLNPKIKSLRLLLAPSGSGGSVGKILLGAALLGLGLSGVGLLAASPATLALMGGAMLLQGVSSLFGRPNKPENDEDSGKKSQIFRSPLQTFTEGGRISVGYGVHLIGLTLVSFRIETAYTPS